MLRSNGKCYKARLFIYLDALFVIVFANKVGIRKFLDLRRKCPYSAKSFIDIVFKNFTINMCMMMSYFNLIAQNPGIQW